ncbi:putative LIM/homeobox protein Awh [Hypsibius exemplaris]|uniref:LIM/homeobox protein Awh n=1 Tax=Hypsibius exemplaris TaxID=2072580 RepID=A0A9X6RK83_HYPEX|nr:putative LIM/homeobox protein Awh [Hypsibius exemplaris]
MRCSKCCRAIAATDWVRKAKASVYHLACFACDTCKRQLSTGEEFTLATIEGDIHLLCKSHYIDTQDGSSDSDNSSTSSNGKPKTKRMRTTFTDEQLQVLQANFNLDSNPDGQDLERIAQMTGLSKRVTQVWFQNSRARQKKHQQQSQRKLNGGGGRQNCQSLEKNSSCAVSSRMMEEARQTDCLSVCSGGKSAALQSDIHHHHLMEQSLSPQSSCGDNIDSGSQFSSSFL